MVEDSISTRAETEGSRDFLPPCDVLRDAITRRLVTLPSGEEKKLCANISALHSRTLYEAILVERPAVVVEIGMAQGIATLSILSALAQTGGRLISIDPYVGWKSGREAALHSVRRAGFGDIHSHIEDFSFKALPALMEQGLQPNFAYIDGAHDFGNAFIDAFYLDLLLQPGGVLAFNDAGWPDVYRVIRFIETRRGYERLDVGLTRDFRGRNPFYTLARLVLRRSREDRYFRKPPIAKKKPS